MTNDMLAVASQSGETVEFFDLDTYRHLGSVAVPPEPHRPRPPAQHHRRRHPPDRGRPRPRAGGRPARTAHGRRVRPAVHQRRGGPGRPGRPLIDTGTNRIVHTIATTLPVSPLHVTSGRTLLAGQWRYAALGSGGGFTPLDGMLTSYDTDGWNPAGGTGTQRLPINIRSDPSGERAFVSNLNSGTVSVVELSGMRTVGVLTVDRSGKTAGKRYEQGVHGLAFISS